MMLKIKFTKMQAAVYKTVESSLYTMSFTIEGMTSMITNAEILLLKEMCAMLTMQLIASQGTVYMTVVPFIAVASTFFQETIYKCTTPRTVPPHSVNIAHGRHYHRLRHIYYHVSYFYGRALALREQRPHGDTEGEAWKCMTNRCVRRVEWC